MTAAVGGTRHDLIIAATAIAHNCAVLTENIREFAKVPGLEAVAFSRPL